MSAKMTLVTDWIDQATMAGFDPSADWSMSYWFYIHDLNTQGILCGPGDAVGDLCQTYNLVGGMMQFSMETTGVNTVAVLVDTWHDAVILKTGSTTAKILLDGYHVGSLTDARTLVPPYSFLVGGWGGGSHLVGNISHLKLWQAALTTDEIESERLSFPPVRSANLLGYYPFAANANKAAGSWNDLTAHGSVVWDSLEPALPQISPLLWRVA